MNFLLIDVIFLSKKNADTCLLVLFCTKYVYLSHLFQFYELTVDIILIYS